MCLPKICKRAVLTEVEYWSDSKQSFRWQQVILKRERGGEGEGVASMTTLTA